MSTRRTLLAAMIASGMALPGLALPDMAHAADGPAKKKGGGLSYIQFDTLTATIVRPDGRRGVMTVDSGVDVPNAGLHQRAVLSVPLLQAAYIQWLTSYAASLGPGQPPDADYMSVSLQHQTDSILGRPGAHLLLGAILIN